MRSGRLVLLLCLAISAGCGPATRPGPMLKELDSYERDARALLPAPPASDFLAEASAKRQEADPLLKQGKNEDASPILTMGVADARLALASAQEAEARQEADSCRAELERLRKLHQEAVLILRETEKVAKAPAHSLPPEPPGVEAGSLSDLPPSLLAGREPPTLTADQLQENWEMLAKAAAARRIAIAGPSARFEDQIERTRDPETKDIDRPVHLYVATRALQEAEAVVRREASIRDCRAGGEAIALLSDAHDLALRTTIQMERDMETALGAEARDRQAELYDALHQLEGKYAHIQKTARGTILSLADILFDFDKATLKRDVEFNLVKVATILNQFPEMKIAVEGHTDNIGTAEYNLDLSQRRAQAVNDFLVSQDVAQGRMTVAGYGLDRPVADNATEEGRKKNRRVDLVIQEQQ
jgi:outer membrane protein OmpA-like peptidoglycan-associated protein